MNIIGPDALVFGVENVKDCEQYLIDYGLDSVGDGRFEALDGTSIVVLPVDVLHYRLRCRREICCAKLSMA